MGDDGSEVGSLGSTGVDMSGRSGGSKTESDVMSNAKEDEMSAGSASYDSRLGAPSKPRSTDSIAGSEGESEINALNAGSGHSGVKSVKEIDTSARSTPSLNPPWLKLPSTEGDAEGEVDSAVAVEQIQVDKDDGPPPMNVPVTSDDKDEVRLRHFTLRRAHCRGAVE